ncbi:hypothetical protein BMYO_1391 [Bifidobacterium myosotis]|uniref:Uncharacterized protein n=1 Tax=Bifidobacterium myosotis TaxID=1630166 RepID=A0A261FL50_9BIFI|nr:hypothetical protein BMYO_1391 [Bifidobacterium myosotis]
MRDRRLGRAALSVSRIAYLHFRPVTTNQSVQHTLINRPDQPVITNRSCQTAIDNQSMPITSTDRTG